MRSLFLLLCASLALTSPALHAENQPSAITVGTSEIATNAPSQPADPLKFTELKAGPYDGKIAFTAAQMLEQDHYLHLIFNADVSSKMLDVYINKFDPQHIQFLQSDIEEFNQYRKILGDLTKEKRDTSPAYAIFNRFMERLAQRTAYAKELLLTEDFTFTNSDSFSLNRKTAPFPKDMDEAKQLWRQRLRYEYLEEKLSQENPQAMAVFLAMRLNPVQWGFMDQDTHQQIVKFVDTRYNRVFRNFREWENNNVLELYLTSLALVYDPHSDYEGKHTLDEFAIQMSLSLFGIGAVLTSDDDGYCKIITLQPGMPAAKTKKIKPGDRIVAVAQGTNEPVDVVQMPLTKVVDKIRGPKGTTVQLTLIPADSPNGAHVVVPIVRDEIKLADQQAKAKLVELPGENGATSKLGVIDLPSFYATFPVMGSRSRNTAKSATVDVNRLLQKLEKEHVDGVILDLRRNGGGSLPEAIDLAGLFIKSGPVVQVASSDGSVQVDEDPDPRIQYDGPLVVLVDRFSASASEIVAGALQDYGRAVLVGGQSTHGKGTVQSMSQLAPQLYRNGEYFGEVDPSTFGALKYTTNKFYRVSGSSTQLKGVVPDIVVPSTLDYLETEEASEEYALKWDEIKSADYEKFARVQQYLPELEKRSATRVAASRDFGYIRQDVDFVKKTMAEKSASLNEEKRLKEAREAEERRQKRDADLKAHPPAPEKIYDLTLKEDSIDMVEEKATNNLTAAEQASGTNAVKSADVAVTKPAGSPASPDDDDDSPAATSKPVTLENMTPEERAPLEEAERVLLDYISLMHGGHVLTGQYQTPAPSQP